MYFQLYHNGKRRRRIRWSVLPKEVVSFWRLTTCIKSLLYYSTSQLLFTTLCLTRIKYSELLSFRMVQSNCQNRFVSTHNLIHHHLFHLLKLGTNLWISKRLGQLNEFTPPKLLFHEVKTIFTKDRFMTFSLITTIYFMYAILISKYDLDLIDFISLFFHW